MSEALRRSGAESDPGIGPRDTTETATGGAGAPPAQRPGPLVWAGIAVGVAAVSTSSILIRVADAHELALSFWRCAGGALVLAPFALRRRVRLDRAHRARFAAAGVLLALHFASFITALSLTTVASAAVLVTMAPLFVGAGAALFLHESPSRRTWAGIAMAVAGALVIAIADLGFAGGAGTRALLGDLLAFSGAITVSGYLLLGRDARATIPAAQWAGGVYAIAAGLLLVWCLLARVPLGGYTPATWLAIAALIAGPQLLGHTVFNTLLGTVSATVVAVAVLAEPIGSTLLAGWLLDELPAPLFWVGAPFVIAGVFLAAVGERSARVTIDPATAVATEEPAE